MKHIRAVGVERAQIEIHIHLSNEIRIGKKHEQ
jgi:hypothetical protein